MHIAGLARRLLATERTFVGSGFLQCRHDAPDRVLPKAGADDPDKGQMIAAMDAGHQRTEFAVGGLPAAKDDLMPGAAFGLGPALGPAGLIGPTELLRDDALQRQLAGRAQHGVATR